MAKNARNTEAKTVKTSVYGEAANVLFTVESFFDDPEHLRATLTRSIEALRTVSDADFEAMHAARATARTRRAVRSYS